MSIEERRKAIIDAMSGSEYISNMELEFLELEEDSAVARFPFADRFLNPYGSVHGGFLYSVADTVAGSLAAMSGNYCTTADGSMNFFEPAINTQYVYCYATIKRKGKHLINVSVELKNDDGMLLDDASINYFVIKQAEI